MQPHAIQTLPRPGIRRAKSHKPVAEAKALFAAEQHIQSVIVGLQNAMPGRVGRVEINLDCARPRVRIQVRASR